MSSVNSMRESEESERRVQHAALSVRYSGARASPAGVQVDGPHLCNLHARSQTRVADQAWRQLFFLRACRTENAASDSRLCDFDSVWGRHNNTERLQPLSFASCCLCVARSAPLFPCWHVFMQAQR